MKIPACDNCETPLTVESGIIPENTIHIEMLEATATLHDGPVGNMKLPRELDFCDSNCMEAWWHGVVGQLHAIRTENKKPPQASQTGEGSSGKVSGEG